ncbi:MAG: NAD(P)H-hydrate dehydratase [Actinomycetota bacterium]
MRPLLTPDQARALDDATQAAGTSASTLMERAGSALARGALDLAGGAYGRRAVAVCGIGNNGGDGFVAARHLARAGMRVTAAYPETAEGFSDETSQQMLRLQDTIARIEPWSARTLRDLDRADVVVDALFGTGFHGVPRGVHAEMIEAVNDRAAPVVAADMPSGVDGASGAVDGVAVRAEVTVAFGAEKVGTVLLPGAEYAGFVEIADIGFSAEMVPSDLAIVEREDLAGLLPVRGPEANKRSSGVVLVIAGSRDMTGAPQLVARAAARTGAGLVQVAAPESALPAIQAGLTEATFLGLPETEIGTVAPGALDVLKERIGASDAIVLGPGVGRHPDTSSVVRDLVRSHDVPIVVDADALNAFEGRAGGLASRAAQIVITPHAGEAERLLGIPAAEIDAHRIRFARDLAGRAGAVTLLKGKPTVIASSSDTAMIVDTGTPALATAGTGDVLSGMIGGLLARGVGSLDAACAAAFIHGIAGRIASEDLGEGVTADDVLEALPRARDEVERP